MSKLESAMKKLKESLEETSEECRKGKDKKEAKVVQLPLAPKVQARKKRQKAKQR